MKTALAIVAIIVVVFAVFYFGDKTSQKQISLIPRVEMTCDGQKCLK